MISALPQQRFPNSRQRLIDAGLDNTSWGVTIIQAESRGCFTTDEKARAVHNWPDDDEFREAVLNDKLEFATARLITIEKSLAEDGWRAVKRYREECERKKAIGRLGVLTGSPETIGVVRTRRPF